MDNPGLPERPRIRREPDDPAGTLAVAYEIGMLRREDGCPMVRGPKILLVSPDLLATSRLGGLCREAGATLETLRGLGEDPHGGPHDVLLLDLQAFAEDPAAVVSRARTLAERHAGDAAGVRPRIVAFGPHVARDRLAQARDAGADDVVSRGELLGGFPGLLRRWLDQG